jgi:hypothetical protein
MAAPSATIRMILMAASFAALASLASAQAPVAPERPAGCAETYPPRYHERPPADGLAILSSSNPGQILLETGAAWVEVARQSPDPGEEAVFTEGPGRYRVAWADMTTPACRAAIEAYGFDPDTLTWRGEVGAQPHLALEQACLTGRRIGDYKDVPIPTKPGDPVYRAALEEWRSQWIAPYHLTGDMVVDTTSTTRPPAFWAEAFVVRAATGERIAEVRSYYWDTYEPFEFHTCGPAETPARALRDVFAGRPMSPSVSPAP